MPCPLHLSETTSASYLSTLYSATKLLAKVGLLALLYDIMLSRRLATSRPLTHLLRNPVASRTQIRCLTQADIDDPDMNGGYINPPRIKRQHRDPYADWWDKQERRNFGEPVHEDNDILGMFSPHEYTHFTPQKGIFLFGCSIATTLGLCGVVSLYYPDRPSVPRTFPGGLDRELGGEETVLAPKDLEDTGV